MKEIKVGILGAGRMGKLHGELITKIPDVKLVGIFDTNLEKAQELAKQLDVRIYKTEEEIINDLDINTFIIATPTPFHYSSIIKIAERGGNIFCEKPLARTLREGEEIVKVVIKNKIKFGINFQRRFSWPEKRIKELISLLGEPKAGRIAYINAGYKRKKGDWFADFDKCGGFILDTMIHLFDLFRWYFGDVKSVFANGLLLSQSLSEPMDYAFVNLTFKNEFIGLVEGGWIRRGVGIGFTCYLIGTEGTIVYDEKDGKIKVFTKNKNFEELRKEEDFSPVFESLKTFIKKLKNEDISFPSIEDGIDTLRIALSAIKSAQKGETVYLTQ